MELKDCQNITHFNTKKAERILRTCTVQVLKAQIAYYESLSTFHEDWIIELQEDAIESAIGMIPAGYGPDLNEYFRDVLWDTTYADLNPPKELIAKTEQSPQPAATLADKIKALRDECRLTTEDLAENLNVDARSVYRHLSGKAIPRMRQIAAYEKLFSDKLGKPVRLETSVKRQ